MTGAIPKDAQIEMPYTLYVERPDHFAPLAPSIVELPFTDSDTTPCYIVRKVSGGTYEYLHCNGTWRDTTMNDNEVFTGIYPSKDSAYVIFSKYVLDQ